MSLLRHCAVCPTRGAESRRWSVCCGMKIPKKSFCGVIFINQWFLPYCQSITFKLVLVLLEFCWRNLFPALLFMIISASFISSISFFFFTYQRTWSFQHIITWHIPILWLFYLHFCSFTASFLHWCYQTTSKSCAWNVRGEEALFCNFLFLYNSKLTMSFKNSTKNSCVLSTQVQSFIWIHLSDFFLCSYFFILNLLRANYGTFITLTPKHFNSYLLRIKAFFLRNYSAFIKFRKFT